MLDLRLKINLKAVQLSEMNPKVYFFDQRRGHNRLAKEFNKLRESLVNSRNIVTYRAVRTSLFRPAREHGVGWMLRL